MPNIFFTQFLRPDGRRNIIAIDRPPHICAVADKLLSAGLKFEAEILIGGKVSLTITSRDQDEAIEICDNGPEVPLAVDRLFSEFDLPAYLKRMARRDAAA